MHRAAYDISSVRFHNAGDDIKFLFGEIVREEHGIALEENSFRFPRQFPVEICSVFDLRVDRACGKHRRNEIDSFTRRKRNRARNERHAFRVGTAPDRNLFGRARLIPASRHDVNFYILQPVVIRSENISVEPGEFRRFRQIFVVVGFEIHDRPRGIGFRRKRKASARNQFAAFARDRYGCDHRRFRRFFVKINLADTNVPGRLRRVEQQLHVPRFRRNIFAHRFNKPPISADGGFSAHFITDFGKGPVFAFARENADIIKIARLVEYPGVITSLYVQNQLYPADGLPRVVYDRAGIGIGAGDAAGVVFQIGIKRNRFKQIRTRIVKNRFFNGIPAGSAVSRRFGKLRPPKTVARSDCHFEIPVSLGNVFRSQNDKFSDIAVSCASDASAAYV